MPAILTAQPTLIVLHPSGFEVHLTVPTLEDLDGTIADLLARGYRPARSGDIWERSPEGEPICPKHRVVMPERSKQGDTWHSHPVINPCTGELLYCRGYAGPNSPGWVVDSV